LSILFQNYLVRTFLCALNYVWSFAKNNFICFKSFTHLCIHCLGPSFPLAPSFSPHPHPLPGRICFALFSNFVEEKT
jgi:hypothetical protein